MTQESSQADNHLAKNPSIKPMFKNKLANEITALIKHDKNSGNTHAIFLGASLGMFPTILGCCSDIFKELKLEFKCLFYSLLGEMLSCNDKQQRISFIQYKCI